MPTASAPFGILPSWHPTGQIRPTAYVSSNATDLMIPSGTNIAFYKGQPITVAIGTGAAVNGVTIVAGQMVFKPWTANTDKIFGVFAGVEYVDAQGKPWVNDTWPASQTLLAGARQVVYVWDDPEIIYRAQMDGAPSAGATYGLTGKQVNGSNFASGNALTGLSQATLSATIPATGAQGQFRIIKLANDTNNTSSDTYPVFEVKVQYSPFAAAIVSL